MLSLAGLMESVMSGSECECVSTTYGGVTHKREDRDILCTKEEGTTCILRVLIVKVEKVVVWLVVKLCYV